MILRLESGRKTLKNGLKMEFYTLKKGNLTSVKFSVYTRYNRVNIKCAV